MRRGWWVSGLVMMMGIGCRSEAPSEEAPAVAAPAAASRICALSHPVAWLSERLGGTLVQVEQMLPPGEDPPFWQPAPERVAALASCDLIVANGAGYERWMEAASLPRAKVVEAARDVEPITLPGTTHSHGGDAPHSHAGLDPHTWSDPLAFLQEAKVIHRALATLRPADAAQLDHNLATLEAALEALHAEWRALGAPPAGLALAGSHPAWNYLARRYAFTLQSFTFDPDTPPTAAEVEALRAWASGHERAALWWEDTPTEAVVAAFGPGFTHVRVDPLEQPAEGRPYDYLAQARANVEAVRRLFLPPN